MFHNGRKTIGVFLNRAELAFQQEFSKYLIYAAQEKNYNVAFMTSYGVKGKKNEYDVNESDIIDFAPIERFDAIVVAFDTYDTPIFRTKLIAGLKQRAKGPIISFREKSEDFYNVITDANLEVETFVEHFATVHNAKHICFMAGYAGHYDSNKRLENYYNAMAKFGLPIYKNSVFYGDMWTRKGEEAYNYFFSNADAKPDAIICANDFMARSLCEACIKHGLKVPQDVMISGFDNAIEAHDHNPRLTTVGANYERMATETVQLLDDLLQGKTRERDVDVPSTLFYRESCGCSDVISQTEYGYTKRKTANEVFDQHIEQLYFNIDMNSCITLEEMKTTISKNMKLIGDYDEFYLCHFMSTDGSDGVESLAGDEKTTIEFGYRNGKRMEENSIQFYQKDLLPDCISDESLKVYYFRILHNRDKSFGYTVLSYKNRADALCEFYHDWNLTISLALHDYYIRKQLEELVQINKDNSIRDYMTKVYNRLGLDSYLEIHWNRWIEEEKDVTFLSVDLDGLKKINDTYGHAEGDWVICSVANAIQTSVEKYGVTARIGGDEFVAVFPNEETGVAALVKDNIDSILSDLNEKSNKKYVIGCSVGEYTVKINKEMSLQECIWNSDVEMYKIKRKRKEKNGEK